MFSLAAHTVLSQPSPLSGTGFSLMLWLEPDCGGSWCSAGSRPDREAWSARRRSRVLRCVRAAVAPSFRSGG